ncbi:MAG: phosphatase PAP2 family protein [Candidatus Levybacteria bacterium]|nr:phosphatase PAP2 family protein [Candidatus Levybacteria bacterium]
MKQINKFLKFLKSSHLSLILFVEIIIGILVSLGSMYLFLKIGHEIVSENIFFLDSLITNLIYAFRSDSVTSLMLFFTSLGSGLALISLSIIMILYIGTVRRKDVAIYLGILYSGILVNVLLKFLYQRPRPENLPLIHENSLSFPSAHAMNSFLFFAALSYFIFRETNNKKITLIVSLISIVIILFIGISRIYLGVHYPSDVVGGFVAGFLWFTSAILFEKTIIFKRLYKSNKK